MNIFRRWAKDVIVTIDSATYPIITAALYPLNMLLAAMLRRRVRSRSVLHVSAMVHVAFHTVRLLREHGVDADYLAVNVSPWWNQSDYLYRPSRLPIWSAIKEMWWVWAVVSRYDVIHSHFMVGITRSGWEWPILTRMARHIVVHYRGCEIRDRALNQRLHPQMNICQECDYHASICEGASARRRIAAATGSAFLVTTPDLNDFVPNAIHVPFFVTREAASAAATVTRPRGAAFKIVHATNHPGIEGTRHIRDAIESLRRKGHAIEFVELRGVTHDRVMKELEDADVSVGKMKMGYYANFQVESLAAGVPAVTHVRDELVTDAISSSGLILASLDTLESTLERLITHPEELAAKRRVARASVARLHNNDAIATQLKTIYDGLFATRRTSHGWR